MQNIIEKEKDKKNMSNVQQLSLSLYKDMLKRKEENSFVSMTKIMIEYHQIIGQLAGRTEPNLVETREGVARDIDELITSLDTERLF